MAEGELIRVLLVEDDEDDYILTSSLFTSMRGGPYKVDWFKTYESGLKALAANVHDICLVDYRLGMKSGIDLIREALAKGCQSPLILLTGLGQHTVDVEAMKAGAADYLVKNGLQAESVERSIRYALERKRSTAMSAFEQASLAAFGAEVGLAVTKNDSLPEILFRCAESMVRYLGADIAQIWVLNETEKQLCLKASAGAVSEIAAQEKCLARINPDQPGFQCREPVLIRPEAGDPRVPPAAKAESAKVVSYAGYPLTLDDRLIGLVSVYSQSQLASTALQALGSVANGIALCIQRKLSDAALSAVHTRYQSVVENLKEVVFQVNEFAHWTSLNSAWTEITGFEVADTLGRLFFEFVHHDDRQRNSFILLQLFERKLDYCRYETRVVTKDGKFRWAEVYAQLTLHADGTVLGISGSLTDITERKHAASLIEKLAAFPRVNPNPVLEFDADGNLTYHNDAAKETVRALGCQHPLEILPKDTPNLVRETITTARSKLREIVSIGGRTLSWSFFPITVNGVVHCYGTDITDMLSLEAQFRHAQKLESVGQLAAGVAHDFNNILTVIQGYSDLLLVKCATDATLATPLKQISDSARRAAALTRQLLMFSRKQVIQLRTVDLNAVLRNVENLLSRLLGEDVAVVNHYGADLPPIEADAGMIEQVVMNLAVNARDAMPKGGQLQIRTTCLDVDEQYVRLHPQSRTGLALCLSVTDTGCGMDAATLNRIFEPFFSTKEVGKGTGLGLATVHGIVTQHQGWIDVKSQVGVGTTFHVFLPASPHCANSARDGAAPQLNSGSPGKQETILLVEDEPVLREWVKQVLVGHNYNVVEAGSGVEALRVWDEMNGAVDLLLTDMVMPEGMSGRELARQLRGRTPGLRVIFTSGYSPDSLQGDPEVAQIPFLSKPYPAGQLTLLVREVLDDVRGTTPAAVEAASA